MGITIHYSGRVRDWNSLTDLLTTAQLFCSEREWMFALYDDPLGIMEDRDHDDPGYIEYDGPFRGMVIRPHGRCEAVRLDFNTSNEMTPAFTKTQFAPFNIHEEIVALFRDIEPFFTEFVVIDESGLWETGDAAAAQSIFESLKGVIESMSDAIAAEGLSAESPNDIHNPFESDFDFPTDEQPYG